MNKNTINYLSKREYKNRAFNQKELGFIANIFYDKLKSVYYSLISDNNN